MAPGWRDKDGRRRAAPYNTHVQKDRQDKYYARKKVMSKYRRFRRYEEKQAGHDAVVTSKSPSENWLMQDPEALEEEYERRLSLSYGGGADDAARSLPRKPMRSRLKKSRTRAEAPNAEAAAPQQKSKAKRPPVVEAQLEVDVQTGGASAASSSSAFRGGRSRSAPIRSAAAKVAVKAAATASVGGRFSKELRHYQQTQEAKQRERQRREEEAQARNRKRRDTAKNRAVMGQLLAKRNAKGQPKMQNMLEALSAKLQRERSQ